MANKTRVSEIFTSIQGEGKYTGVTTIWVRYFLCNLSCDGFGQKDPTDKKTYELPYKEYDVSLAKDVTDLPVWDKGCDSSYSWHKKFRHLCPEMTDEEIGQTVLDLYDDIKSNMNSPVHIAFTGGEPMLHQESIMGVLRYIKPKGFGGYVTVETNGTQPILPEMAGFIGNLNRLGTGWFWSVSPKLFTVSGEKNKKAIVPQVIMEYSDVAVGQLKPVLGTKETQWTEWDNVYNGQGLYKTGWPVYVMAVGATEEDQQEVAAKVCNRAISEGYYFSARAHCHIFGNQIGT